MIPSPLELERCFFTRVHIDATPTNTQPSKKGRIAVQTQTASPPEGESAWRVSLSVSLQGDGDAGPPTYVGEVEVVGFFTVAASFPAEKAPGMVAANAPAVLYGMAREMIANVTARGPYPLVRLPTVTFVDQVSPPPAAASPQVSAPARGSRRPRAGSGRGKP